MRLHLVRSAVRIAVLMAGDAAALLLLRVLLRGVRDNLWLGEATASIISRLVPGGAVPLLQLLPAVLLGLIVLDTMGQAIAGATPVVSSLAPPWASDCRSGAISGPSSHH
jgi:hypothetical protein